MEAENVVPLGSLAQEEGPYGLIDRNGDLIEIAVYVERGDRLPRISVVDDRVPLGYVKLCKSEPHAKAA